MIKHIQEYNQLNPSKPVIVSVEIEKKKPELMDFVPLVDVVSAHTQHTHTHKRRLA